MDAFLDALQWPAMAVTLLAAWLVAARSAARRRWGFGVFVLSNLLWSAWGLHTQAYALIVLQVGLFLLNLRGVRKNREAADPGDATHGPAADGPGRGGAGLDEVRAPAAGRGGCHAGPASPGSQGSTRRIRLR